MDFHGIPMKKWWNNGDFLPRFGSLGSSSMTKASTSSKIRTRPGERAERFGFHDILMGIYLDLMGFLIGI